MSYTTLPVKNLLGAHAIISSNDLAATADTDRLIRLVLEGQEERVVRRILKDCSTTVMDDKSKDISIRLECFVFSRQDLEALLLKTREQARLECERWMRWN
jgi:hypothetical protein